MNPAQQVARRLPKQFVPGAPIMCQSHSFQPTFINQTALTGNTPRPDPLVGISRIITTSTSPDSTVGGPRSQVHTAKSDGLVATAVGSDTGGRSRSGSTGGWDRCSPLESVYENSKPRRYDRDLRVHAAEAPFTANDDIANSSITDRRCIVMSLSRTITHFFHETATVPEDEIYILIYIS